MGTVEWFDPFSAPFHEGEPPLWWASRHIPAQCNSAYVAPFEQSGCDELILIPCSSELDQVALLAEAIK